MYINAPIAAAILAFCSKVSAAPTPQDLPEPITDTFPTGLPPHPPVFPPEFPVSSEDTSENARRQEDAAPSDSPADIVPPPIDYITWATAPTTKKRSSSAKRQDLWTPPEDLPDLPPYVNPGPFPIPPIATAEKRSDSAKRQGPTSPPWPGFPDTTWLNNQAIDPVPAKRSGNSKRQEIASIPPYPGYPGPPSSLDPQLLDPAEVKRSSNAKRQDFVPPGYPNLPPWINTESLDPVPPTEKRSGNAKRQDTTTNPTKPSIFPYYPSFIGPIPDKRSSNTKRQDFAPPGYPNIPPWINTGSLDPVPLNEKRQGIVTPPEILDDLPYPFPGPIPDKRSGNTKRQDIATDPEDLPDVPYPHLPVPFTGTIPPPFDKRFKNARRQDQADGYPHWSAPVTPETIAAAGESQE